MLRLKRDTYLIDTLVIASRKPFTAFAKAIKRLSCNSLTRSPLAAHCFRQEGMLCQYPIFTNFVVKLADDLDFSDTQTLLRVLGNDRQSVLAYSRQIIPSHRDEILSLRGEQVTGFLLLIDFVSSIPCPVIRYGLMYSIDLSTCVFNFNHGHLLSNNRIPN